MICIKCDCEMRLKDRKTRGGYTLYIWICDECGHREEDGDF
jgi:ribosomal protein L37AE/L43A